MDRLHSIWQALLPNEDDLLLRGRAGLVAVTCLGLMAVVLALILVWLVTGDLAWETVLLGLILSLLLTGIVALARIGRVRSATWLLVLLLLLLITADAASFGLGSPAATAYIIPVLLATCGLGLWAGLGIALFSSVAVWLIAWGAFAAWYEPWEPFDLWHLTFTAPFLTVLLWLVVLMAGFWTHVVTGAVPTRSRAVKTATFLDRGEEKDE